MVVLENKEKKDDKSQITLNGCGAFVDVGW